MTRVLLFHTLKQAAGVDHIHIPIHGPINENDFWTLLLAQIPQLAPYRAHTRVACNQTYLGPGDCIRPGDEVALIPPVSGG
jgi:molybdopterin converting factor small subunit